MNVGPHIIMIQRSAIKRYDQVLQQTCYIVSFCVHVHSSCWNCTPENNDVTYIISRSKVRSWYPARPGPRFIKLKRYELVLLAHLHMRIVKIQRVGQSARILPIHVKEGDIREKNYEVLYSRKWQAKVTRINKISYLFSLIKRGPGYSHCDVIRVRSW